MIALAEQDVFHRRDSRVASAILAAREAQPAWAARSHAERARLIGNLRNVLAGKVEMLGRSAAAVHGRPLAEKLVSEVLPLIEACRFLERNAAKVLRPRRFGRRGRPLWLRGSTFEVQRKALGLVLIVAPSNYPLFLPAVQTLHALAAGNAVLLKPAEGASDPAALFLELIISDGHIPADLVQLLPDTVEAAIDAARCGVDKAIFTGSSGNGRAFLRELAETNTPSVMELSGADAVYLRHDAEVELATKAIAFGLRLNAGNTCIAPHTVIAHRAVAGALRDFPVVTVESDDEALAIICNDEHGLGCTIFSRDENAARALAARVPTGFVTINDLIVPTADPRFPFGGVRASGFGTTRGAEGLLEMTYPHVVALRNGNSRPHYDGPKPGDAALFAAFIRLLHLRGWRARWRALGEVRKALRSRGIS